MSIKVTTLDRGDLAGLDKLGLKQRLMKNFPPLLRLQKITAGRQSLLFLRKSNFMSMIAKMEKKNGCNFGSFYYTPYKRAQLLKCEMDY